MSGSDELAHCLADSGAGTAFVPQDLYPRIRPLLRDEGCGLRHVVVAAYSDYLRQPADLPVPEFVAAARGPVTDPGAGGWSDMLARRLAPGPLSAGPDELCVMPYTSGTTGQPKACMHTHRSVMSSLVGSTRWFGIAQDTIHLSVLPFFHVPGMTGGLTGLNLGAPLPQNVGAVPCTFRPPSRWRIHASLRPSSGAILSPR